MHPEILSLYLLLDKRGHLLFELLRLGPNELLQVCETLGEQDLL